MPAALNAGLYPSSSAKRTLHVDDWFSYQPKDTKVSPPSGLDLPVKVLPSMQADATVFGSLAEEVIVIGERQKRDFQGVQPSDELTGPRGLDAAQPVVPWIGTSCSYKTLCYDMKQPPLREILEKLLHND